jgi:hypothetical protein
MRKLIRYLGVFASVLVGVMALSMGVASADHDEGVWEDCTDRADCSEVAPHWAPVGQNLLGDPDFPGRDGLPGGPFDDPNSPEYGANAVAGITRNPNCPLHWPLP